MAISPPPLLVSFSSLEELVDAAKEFASIRQLEEIRDLVDRGLPPAVSQRVVAVTFGMSSRFVGTMLRNPRKYYRTFTIRKGKKLRKIEAPRVALKIIQKWLATYIARSTTVPNYVYGFVADKSHFDAAASHCDHDWIVSIDIQDFFPSISQSHVVEAVRGLGYAEHSANLIANICCLDGHLPQGSPASPVLSNIVFARTDDAFAEFCVARNITYTRYADDLVFSGKGQMPENCVQSVTSILSSFGWVTADRKTRWSKRPSRLKVHGLLVQEKYPKLTKGYRNKIRAYDHMLKAGKVRDSDIARLRGHVTFATHIETLRRELSRKSKKS